MFQSLTSCQTLGEEVCYPYQLGFTYTWCNIREEFAVKVMIEKMSTGDGDIRIESNAREEGSRADGDIRR